MTSPAARRTLFYQKLKPLLRGNEVDKFYAKKLTFKHEAYLNKEPHQFTIDDLIMPSFTRLLHFIFGIMHSKPRTLEDTRVARALMLAYESEHGETRLLGAVFTAVQSVVRDIEDEEEAAYQLYRLRRAQRDAARTA